ncbi:MAG: flagellar hook-associated protein FlgK [Solirubrobacteraceae bacterium]|nr:flagellar hook-associated protein FlgK [Solirubrobacteraceae bacterium]
MSISSFTGLETARRGLLAHQRALEVAGHNIANQATPGYSRQRVSLQASPALAVGPMGSASVIAQLGTGVDVNGIERIRDRFADVQYRAQASRLGDVSTRTQLLGQVELAFSEPGDNGLNAALGRMWSAWSDLANDPTSSPARRVVLDTTKAVADRYAELDAQLALVQSQAQEEYDALVADGGPIHGIVTEIADLNEAIGASLARGDAPNDLLDQRDLLLDRLSEFGQVQVQATLDVHGQPVAGKVDVLLGTDPTPLVSGDVAREPWSVAFAPGGPGVGKLGALADLASAGGPIDAYRQEIAASASALASTINAVHQGAGGPAVLVVPPGSPVPGVARPPLQVDAAIDPAAGGSLAALVAGSGPGQGNDVATAIADLRGGAADEAYRKLVGQVGSEIAQAQRTESSVRSLAGALQDRRDSVAGVSTDEEMADLIRFQRGYEASARVLSAVDEMLDRLINRTGRVGL